MSGGGIQLAREEDAFSVCPARLASHTACSVIITIGVKDGKREKPHTQEAEGLSLPGILTLQAWYGLGGNKEWL